MGYDLCGLFQDFVPFKVKVHVVILLEIVDVDHDQGEGASPPLCGFDLIGQILVEVSSVVEPGELVGDGEALDFFFQLLSFRDVFDNRVVVYDFSGFVLDRGRCDGGPKEISVLAFQREVFVLDDAFFLEFVDEVAVVFRVIVEVGLVHIEEFCCVRVSEHFHNSRVGFEELSFGGSPEDSDLDVCHKFAVLLFGLRDFFGQLVLLDDFGDQVGKDLQGPDGILCGNPAAF